MLWALLDISSCILLLLIGIPLYQLIVKCLTKIVKSLMTQTLSYFIYGPK
uniref:Uncharacterized protein n=1 Tax=Rhizophora mucronata TaxID=61149 RepID=A0A2P2PRB0_RHIMU